jgi:hypothetical protein
MAGLRIAAIVWIALSVLCALAILLDLFRRPQPMWIMNAVWPLTALYAGVLALIAYAWFGRAPASRDAHAGHHHHDKKPFWQATLIGATHCGAGCALGDFAAEWLAFATGFALFGSAMAGRFFLAFVLAYLAGIFFQFFSIAPMRGLGLRDGLVAAIKADTLSLVAYEIGMFAWMIITHMVLLPGLEPTSWVFWLMMQIAMLLGLATTYPVNWWLIRAGVKEAM